MNPTTRQMITAGALAAAAGIHLAATRVHLEEAVSHGIFFLMLGALQAVWAVRIARRVSARERTIIGGTHLAVIGLWIVSRAAGLPGEPPEAVGAADLAATLAAATIAFTTLAGRRVRLPRSTAIAPAMVLTLALSISVGVALGASPGDHAHATGATHGTDHGADHAGAHDIDGVYLHGLTASPDAGAQPGRAADAPLDARRTTVGSMPTAIAIGLDRIWVTDREDGTLIELDLEGRVLRTARIAEGPTAVTVAYGAVWVTDFTDDLLLRVDPETLRAASVPVGGGPTAVHPVGDDLWVASISDGLVQVVDPARMRVVATISVGFGPISISSDDRDVWVVNTLDRAVVRIDAASREIIGAPIPVSAGASGSTVAFGKLWVAGASDGVVDVFDPISGLRHPITVDEIANPGQGPVSVVAAGGRIWVANNHDKTIRAIDPRTYAVGAPLFFSNDLGAHPIAVQLAAEGDSLWVTDFTAGTIARVATS